MIIDKELQANFDKAKELLDHHRSFLVVSHEYTDGDDLGGILAMGRALEKLGKEHVKIAKGGVPDNLLFMPGQAEVLDELSAAYQDYEALITLGCGDLSRSGFGQLQEWRKPILNIDHHHDTKLFGTVNVWDESRAANCELLYAMFKNWRVEIGRDMALDLLTGIFTDTGGFRHANVKAQTFEIAAELLRKGAKLDLISRFTFSNKDLPTLRAWALALEHAHYDPQRELIYTVITEEDLKKVAATEHDLDGVVELLNTIPEAKFSMLLKQRGEEVKGSLRSEPHKGVDVSEIARRFGGGGHKLAAGFKFKGKIEKTDAGWRIT